MSSNKKAKDELIKYYGAECFIEKLHLRVDTEPRRYKSKSQMKKMKKLTYHHIKRKQEGGKATRENGALLSNENHIWFHQQDENVQECLNNIFQEYKQQTDECQIIIEENLKVPFEICMAEFHIEDDKLKYNRLKEKEETNKLIQDYYDDQEK